MTLDAKEVKARIDLVAYCASLGIALKPVGAEGEYRGRCPFHEDDTPSFQVNQRKGLWHCFGCGTGGDVISLEMRRSGVGFREALAILAGPDEVEQRYILCATAYFWHKCLPGAHPAHAYLERRGIGSAEIIERYGIGFAPGGAKTRDWLLGKGFTLGEIESAGLLNQRGLDSFFGRVTFPLVEDDKVINIYGRSLSDNYRHMYLPARRDVIFNIDYVQTDCAILTESVIDALSLVILGFENIVSSLSARLAKRQIEMLAARFKHVNILFDGDRAGQAGAHDTAALLADQGVKTRIVTLPGCSDVNSLYTAGASRQVFEDLL